MTDQEGRYEIHIVRPGQYYLGVNLNHSPSRDTPYPRWFYTGTADPALATTIDFSGKPETRTYEFTLLAQQLAEQLTVLSSCPMDSRGPEP